MSLPISYEEYSQVRIGDKSFWYAECSVCGSSFIESTDTIETFCPRCFKTKLIKADLEAESLAENHIPEPEFFLPYTLQESGLLNTWNRFTSGYWFRPTDLELPNFRSRLSAFYMPVWLVDGLVQANWLAEAGFNYEVVSHKDRYADRMGGWQSEEIIETRQRWEPRLGKLKREYQNIPASALETHQNLIQKLGGFNHPDLEPFSSGMAFANLSSLPSGIQLPDRKTEEAWTEAEPGFMQAAIEECRLAAGADFIRAFRWSPNFSGLNWTLNLLPVYTTYYRDDEGKIQVLFINGQSGLISGIRKASMQRARKITLIILLISAFVFFASLVAISGSIVLPVLFPLGILGMIVTLFLGLAALIPLGMVWITNRNLRMFSG